MAKTSPDPGGASPRPLVATGIMTEFGEVLEDPSVDPNQMPDPILYTPGWSEIRHRRDKEMAEVARNERKARDVIPLPGNVRLVRRTNVNGTPNMEKQVRANTAGYVPVTDADVGKPWFKEIPPGTVRLADGTFVKGDCQYMYCGPEQAARNAHQKHRKTLNRLSAGEDQATRAGVEYESRLLEPLEGNPASRVKVN